jgi:hypothetical protein
MEWGFRRTYTDHIDDVSGTYADNNVLLEEAGPLTALLADPSALRTTGYNTGRARGDSKRMTGTTTPASPCPTCLRGSPNATPSGTSAADEVR